MYIVLFEVGGFCSENQRETGLQKCGIAYVKLIFNFPEKNMNNPFNSLHKISYSSGKGGNYSQHCRHVYSEQENSNGEISSFNASLSSNFLVQPLGRLGKCGLIEDDYAVGNLRRLQNTGLRQGNEKYSRDKH